MRKILTIAAQADSERPSLVLRDLQANDCELLWKWVNDPDVRSNAFSCAPILWEEHVEWFKRKYARPGVMIFIAQDHLGVNIGQVRFEWTGGDDAEIGISVDHARRGAGYATPLLLAAIELFFERTDRKSVSAFIKESNVPSIRAFERAGFRRIGVVEKRGCTAIHFALRRLSEHFIAARSKPLKSTNARSAD
jgi:UDP-2,4-diacetamido-2,4,6-trideoxy-beta-L-altropyranose hydrolase